MFSAFADCLGSPPPPFAVGAAVIVVEAAAVIVVADSAAVYPSSRLNSLQNFTTLFSIKLETRKPSLVKFPVGPVFQNPSLKF